MLHDTWVLQLQCKTQFISMYWCQFRNSWQACVTSNATLNFKFQNVYGMPLLRTMLNDSSYIYCSKLQIALPTVMSYREQRQLLLIPTENSSALINSLLQLIYLIVIRPSVVQMTLYKTKTNFSSKSIAFLTVLQLGTVL